MRRALAPAFAVLATVSVLSGCSLLGGGSVQQFSVGQCVNDPVVAEDGQQEVGTLPVVDCSEPHTGEVFYVEELSGDSVPADVASQADEVCAANFEAFVGLPYEESSLYLTSLYPTEGSWSQGDRQIVCLIVDGEGDAMTGTAKDSGL
jgi:hypothetical protein